MQHLLLLSALLLGPSIALGSTTCQGPNVTYTGTVSKTKSGRTCQNWNETTPQDHNDTSVGDHNFCRNPGNKKAGVWCYTTTTWMKWEKCDVPLCNETEGDGVTIFTATDICEVRNPEQGNEALCKSLRCCSFEFGSCRAAEPEEAICEDKLGCQTGNPLGGDYKGKANLTVSGRSCQKWSMQDPHRHKFTERFVEEGDHNFCRNPDGEPGAWCYTTDADKRWEQCIIPECAIPPKAGCTLGEWSNWTVCSKTCGGGSQSRTRSGEGEDCPLLSEERKCNENPCQTVFSAKEICEVRNPERGNEALCKSLRCCSFENNADGGTCLAAEPEESICEDKLGCQTGSPLGGDYKGKANLTVSGRSCQKWSMQDPHEHKFAERFVDEGDHNFCRNPDGESVGAWCYTTDANKRWEQCIVPECAIPPKGCTLGEWSNWTVCSKTCGRGNQIRERSGTGELCPHLSESGTCNENPCQPVCDGAKEWTSWSECSETCGGGESIRERIVDVTGCGSTCQYETVKESMSCNMDDCPCELLDPPSEWGPWSECSTTQTCGGQGVQTRSKSVVSSMGASCFQENVMMVQSCNSEPCPCPFTPTQWTEWSKCSATCGGGDQQRTREIVLGARSSCFKQRDLQIKECNVDECPERDICTWWEFLGGKVFEKKDLEPFPENTWSCHANFSVLPTKARKNLVGMGSEFVDMLTPIRSLCGACILFTSLEGKESIGIVGHIVPRGWHVSEDIYKELDLGNDSSANNSLLSSHVVECPLDLVKEDMEIKVLKDTEGDIQGYQAINMRNPISRVSMSEDEGKTWMGLTQKERSAAFLLPSGLDPSLNLTIRVESWMGGSNVQVKMDPVPSQDMIPAQGNNVCRGNCKHIGTAWTEWSACTKTCAGGTRLRMRHVVRGSGSSCTRGKDTAEEVCNAQACPCKLNGTEWNEWSTCTLACGASGVGTRFRSREVVIGTDTTCSVDDEVQAVICDGCTTTVAPTTAASTSATSFVTTTTETTTTANLCLLESTLWTAWTQCSGTPCQISTTTRRRDVVTGTGSNCTKAADFEAQICNTECPTTATSPPTITVG